VIVDYAHTDDALENLIRTARELNPKGRIITLFGCGVKKTAPSVLCGGGNWPVKRLTILSSDNPRGEDPLKSSATSSWAAENRWKILIEPDRERLSA